MDKTINSTIQTNGEQLFEQEPKQNILKDIAVIIALLLPFIISIGILVFIV